MAVAMRRQDVIDLLNEALSAEYHSFVGHALNSNPFVPPGCEKDVEFLEAIRDDENANTKALLVQMGRYRAGPTLKAFRFWKEDLNFLGVDWLIVRAAEIAKSNVERIEELSRRLPEDDAELKATFASILEVKKRHAADLAVLAAKRQKERDARRAAAYKATSIPLKKPAAAKPAAGAPAAAPAAGKSPPMPGAPKLPGAPKPPSPPLPGAPKPPIGAPKPPSPPLPPGAPKPPSPPKPPGAPTPPKPPAPKASVAASEQTTATAPVDAPADAGPTLSGPPGPNYKPTPPKPYVPKHKR
jgi:hypothetical protein